MDFISLLHKSNLILHISAGCSALLIGIGILLIKKGGRVHRRSGRIFLFLLFFVILTGLLGVFVFKRNGFLLVITTLSGYMGFSGFRVIRNRSNLPKTIDITIALLALAAVAFFLWYFHSLGMMWSPVIIYSTIGYLILAVCYDLGRYWISEKTYQKLWLHEHIAKLVSAFSGLLSAFTGTVLPQYQPYSQFLPSVLGSLIAINFMVALWRKQSPV
ncbi:hypothetical protein [Pedobacter sp.]|uniref:hypothetical protein n=1 Tax=Pedobacter sp. TaxID=1411316 RepID=UPI003D7FA3FD